MDAPTSRSPDLPGRWAWLLPLACVGFATVLTLVAHELRDRQSIRDRAALHAAIRRHEAEARYRWDAIDAELRRLDPDWTPPAAVTAIREAPRR